MLEDGIYELEYIARDADRAVREDALAVLRDGKIMGSDRFGGLLTGRYEFDRKLERDKVRVCMQVPPGGVLVTGHCAGPEGSMLEISGSVDDGADERSTVVDVAGQPVEVRFTYIGPLPN